jgi:hypothetical protein
MRACIKLAYDVTRYTLKNTISYSQQTNKVIYTYSGHYFPVKPPPKKNEVIMTKVVTEYTSPKVIELEPIVVECY